MYRRLCRNLTRIFVSITTLVTTIQKRNSDGIDPRMTKSLYCPILSKGNSVKTDRQARNIQKSLESILNCLFKAVNQLHLNDLASFRLVDRHRRVPSHNNNSSNTARNANSNSQKYAKNLINDARLATSFQMNPMGNKNWLDSINNKWILPSHIEGNPRTNVVRSNNLLQLFDNR